MDNNLPNNPEAAADLLESFVLAHFSIPRGLFVDYRLKAGGSLALSHRVRRVFHVKQYDAIGDDATYLVETCHAALMATSGHYDDRHGQGSATTDIETRWTRLWALAHRLAGETE